MVNEIEGVIFAIISKLIRMRMWGGKHTEIRNLHKGLPENLISSKQGKKLLEKAIKELMKRDFLITKPSTGEIHISLNPKKIKEIMEFYDKFKNVA